LAFPAAFLVRRPDFRIHFDVMLLLSKSPFIAHDERTLKGNNRVTFPKRQSALIGAILPQMTTTN
jgi:hypothetical protein